MKIVNAKLYEEEIRHKMWEIWYDEKYQFYFGGTQRWDFSIQDGNNGYENRVFAVLDRNDSLIGCISYSVDIEMRVAYSFGAINFSDDKFTFGKALFQVINECFTKYGLNVIEWNVICGNPIEKSYDKMCKKFGGRIIGIRKNRARDIFGNIHDDKIYEILKEDYMNSVKKGGVNNFVRR